MNSDADTYIVDASVWASYFIAVDAWHAPSSDWFRLVRAEEAVIIGPTLLLPEVASAVSRRTGRADLANGALLQMERLRRLQLVSIDLEVARLAARLAGDLRLAGADSVYASLAQALEVRLVTWDNELRDRARSVATTASPSELLGSR